jgi:hypothetical protein
MLTGWEDTHSSLPLSTILDGPGAAGLARIMESPVRQEVSKPCARCS